MLELLKQITKRATSLFSQNNNKPGSSLPRYSTWQTGLSHDLTKEELSQLLANIPGLIFQFYHHKNGERGFHYVSPRLAETLGLNPSDSDYLKNFTQRLDDRDRKAFIDSINVATTSGQSWFFEGRYHKPGSGPMWFRAQSVPERRDDEIVFYGILQDITEEKLASEKFRQHDELLRTTFNATADGILVVDNRGKVTQMNERFRLMWRIPEDMAARGDDSELLSFVTGQLTDPQSFLAEVDDLYHGAREDLNEIAFKDGRVFERYSTTIRVGDEVCGRLWDFRDVTVRKQAEMELRSSRETYRQLLDNTPLPLVISRQGDERVLYANRAALNRFGLTQQDVIDGLNGLDFYCDLKDREVDTWQLGDLGYVKTNMVRLKSPKDPNRVFWAFPAAILTTFEGDNVYIVVMNDVTTLKHTQDALRQSEARYRALVESAEVGIVLFGLDFKRLYANPHYLKLLGYQEGEIDSGSVLDSLHPDDLDLIKRIQREIAAQASLNVDLRYRHHDGHYLDFNVKVTLIKDEHDQPHSVMAIMHDMTAQKSIEKALRLSRESYRNMIDIIPFPIVLTRRQDAIVEYINREGYKFFNLDEEDLARGINGYEFYEKPEDRQVWMAQVNEQGYASNIAMTVRSPKYPEQKHWGFFSVIPTDFEGTEVVLTTFNDLTALRQSQEALRESEEMFRTLTESSPVPIHIRQSDRVIYANPANTAMLGYSMEEFMAMRDTFDLLHPDYFELVKQRSQERLAGLKVPNRYDVQLIAKDGQPRWAHVASELISYKGAPATLITFVDITESVTATQALTASRESYRNLIEVAPLPIVLTRRSDASVKYINAEAYKLFQLTPQDVADGISGYDFYDKAEERQAWLDQVARDGFVSSIEMNVRSPRHPELKFWGSFSAIPTVFEGEEVHLVTFNDLTALKQSQQILRENEAMFRSLTEDSPVPLHIRQNDRIVYVNPASEQLLGYTKDELAAMENPYRVVHPDYRELVLQRSQERQAGLNPPNRYEIKLITKGGQEKWVRTESETITYRGAAAILTTFVDITALIEKEQALRESEAQFRTFTEATPAAICIRKGNRVLYANPATVELLGYSQEELYAMADAFSLVPPEDYGIIASRSQAREAGQQQISRYQHRLRTKNGEYRWVISANESVPYRGETAILTTYIDITDRVSKEQALLESEEMFRTFTEAAPVAICIRKGTRVFYANTSLVELLGYSKEELYAMEDSIRLVPSEEYEDIVQRSLTREAGLNPVGHYQHRLRTKQGEYRWVISVNETVPFHGEPALLTTYLDITDRVSKEQALLESEEMFRTFTEATPVSVHIRQNDRVVYANPATEKLLGYTTEELYAMDNIFSLVHPDYREMVIRRGHERAAGQNPPTRYEFRLITKDGRSVWVHTATERIMYKGAPASLSTFIDITDLIEKDRAIAASEERFRTIIEQSPFSMMVFNTEGQLVQVNPAHDRLWGVEPGKLPDYNILRDEQLVKQGYDQIVTRAFAGETVATPPLEYDLASAIGQGRKIWVEGQLYSVKNPDGSIRQVILIHQDITARIKAQQNLLDKTAELDHFFSLALDMLCIAKLDGELKRVNPAWEQVLGYSTDELVGHNAMEFIHPDDIDKSVEASNELYAGRENINFVNRYRCKDGSYRYIEWRSAPFDNRLVYAAARDVTERRASEAELKRLRNLLHNILDSMPSILIGVNPQGQITHFNREATKLTGLSASEAEGRSLKDILPEFTSEMSRIEEVIRQRATQKREKVPSTQNGEIHYNDITLFPLIANGIDGCVIRIDDVTERVRIEEMIVQSEKMLSVGGLAAGMAHEINNPLAGILQNVQVIHSRLSPSLAKNIRVAQECNLDFESLNCYLERREIWSMVDAIMESGSRAAKIVNNMLSFSRKSGSALVPHDLRQLMDQTLELAASDYDLKKRYDFKRINLVRDYDEGLKEVPCEAGQIQQVFLNILKNGAQAMASVKDRQPEFRIRLKQEPQFVRIEIQDNGPGMDDKTLKRIFEPFYTTKTVGEGTGLGLSVSYFIVTENHGGMLSASSNIGEGTSFIMHLPLTRASR